MSARFEYVGRAYVRPVGRGVVLIDLPGAPQFDDDVLDVGSYRVQIVAEPLSPKEADAAQNALTHR